MMLIVKTTMMMVVGSGDHSKAEGGDSGLSWDRGS